MAVNTAASLTDLVQNTYDQLADFSYTPRLFFAQFGAKKMWDINRMPQRGDVVVFTIWDALAAATSELGSESADVASVSAAETQVSITLREYGSVVTRTQKLSALAFNDVDGDLAKLIGTNMGESMDLVARAAFDAEVGAAFITIVGGGGLGAISPTDILSAAEVRRAFNRLARANTPLSDGAFYNAILHPDVIFDLKNETSTSGGTWRAPKEYADPDALLNGEIGEFEGFKVVDTTNCRIQADAGSATVDAYSSYFFGEQAVGWATAIGPEVRITGPFDNLGRTLNFGWYALGGFSALRAASLHKVFSASSVGAN